MLLFVEMIIVNALNVEVGIVSMQTCEEKYHKNIAPAAKQKWIKSNNNTANFDAI